MGFDISVDFVQNCLPELEIKKRLSHSGEKAAFEAYYQQQRVALKVYNPEANIERLQRELVAMTTISSPFVIELMEFHQKVTPKIHITYSLEEFIDGQELGEMIKINPIPVKDTIAILNNILQGLVACWKHKIVHRDIKPQNIMIRQNGSAVIIDFGIARHVKLESLTGTQWGMGPCTPSFASPEVLQNRKSEIDIKSDLYSLGVTAYMMLTQVHPFLNLSSELDINKILNGEFQSPNIINPNISEDMSDYVMRLMNKDRFARFRDAKHALDELSKLRVS